MTVEVTSRDAEKIAKYMSDLIGRRGLDAIRRRAVNSVGSSIRKQTRAIAPEIFGTTNAALQIQGQAAAPGSSNPTYRL